MIEDLFAGFDPAEVQAARGRIAADKAETRKAVARKSANRHHQKPKPGTPGQGRAAARPWSPP